MIKTIKVIYTSPAIPQYPYDVEVGTVYECIKDNDKYSIRGKNFERVFNFEFIQRTFTPCQGYTWDMLSDGTTSKQTTKVKKTKTTSNQ